MRSRLASLFLASLASPFEEILIASTLAGPEPGAEPGPELGLADEGIFAGAYDPSPGLGVVGFMGSKRRYAPSIVDQLERRWGKAASWGRFYDACAGSAQVALEVRRRAPRLPIVLVDIGPWGEFWAEYMRHPEAVERALSELGLEGRGAVCRRLNGHTPRGAKGAAEFLAMTQGTVYGRLPAGGNTYLGKPWRSTCIPSGRGSRGQEKVIEALRLLRSGPLQALHADAMAAPYTKGAVVYADPDYRSGAGHYRGNRCDPVELVRHARHRGVTRIAISYPRALAIPASSVSLGRRCSPAGSRTSAGPRCTGERLLFPR